MLCLTQIVLIFDLNVCITQGRVKEVVGFQKAILATYRTDDSVLKLMLIFLITKVLNYF